MQINIYVHNFFYYHLYRTHITLDLVNLKIVDSHEEVLEVEDDDDDEDEDDDESNINSNSSLDIHRIKDPEKSQLLPGMVHSYDSKNIVLCENDFDNTDRVECIYDPAGGCAGYIIISFVILLLMNSKKLIVIISFDF